MRLVHARVEALDVPGSFTPGRPTRCRMRLLITAGAVLAAKSMLWRNGADAKGANS